MTSICCCFMVIWEKYWEFSVNLHLHLSGLGISSISLMRLDCQRVNSTFFLCKRDQVYLVILLEAEMMIQAVLSLKHTQIMCFQFCACAYVCHELMVSVAHVSLRCLFQGFRLLDPVTSVTTHTVYSLMFDLQYVPILTFWCFDLFSASFCTTLLSAGMVTSAKMNSFSFYFYLTSSLFAVTSLCVFS